MMKRFTHWPQLWLDKYGRQLISMTIRAVLTRVGFTINWGVLVGYSAVRGHLDASVMQRAFVRPLYTTQFTLIRCETFSLSLHVD